MNQELFEATKITSQRWFDALESKQRIEKIKTPAGIYWLKKSAPARGLFRYYALNLFSGLLQAPLLKAVPQKGGQVALDTEVRRIMSLSKSGISVPKVVAKGSGWILLEDLGESIIDRFKRNRSNQKLTRYLLEICLLGIKQLHLQGHYLSQGFVRNILQIRGADSIGFIDFEDDPIDVLSLDQAQARDLLLFVNSTARFFVKDIEFFNQQIQVFLKDHNLKVVENIIQTNQKLLWITRVPFQKALGHDYQKLKIGILALNINPQKKA